MLRESIRPVSSADFTAEERISDLLHSATDLGLQDALSPKDQSVH